MKNRLLLLISATLFTVSFVLFCILTGYAISAAVDGTWEPVTAWISFWLSAFVGILLFTKDCD